ncbi:MAG: zinc-binding dehydrogenase, partial [Planctomycetaceae bacterium]
LSRGDGSELEQLQQITDGDMFAVVTDATGNRGSMSTAFRYCAHTGTLVYVGITTEEISFTHPTLHRPEITLKASRNALPRDFRRIIGLIESGTINTTPWITHRVPFGRVPAEFESFTKPDSGVLKAMIDVSVT